MLTLTPTLKITLMILAAQIVAVATIWAARRLVRGVRGWILSIDVLRREVARLNRSLLAMQAELARVPARPAMTLPPPMPTVNLGDEDLLSWDDEENSTQT